MTDLGSTITDHTLPGATFSNAAATIEFAPERRQYEAAVQAFAAQTSPSALRAFVAALRRRGIRATQADARESAVDALREALLPLGYTESEVNWHAARRGRRDRHLFAGSMSSLESVINPHVRGGWRWNDSRRH